MSAALSITIRTLLMLCSTNPSFGLEILGGATCIIHLYLHRKTDDLPTEGQTRRTRQNEVHRIYSWKLIYGGGEKDLHPRAAKTKLSKKHLSSAC